MNAVDIGRSDAMLLVHRQVEWTAINLAGAAEDDLDARIEMAAGFEERELRGAIHFQIALGVAHRIYVAGAAREIEDVIYAADQGIDDRLVSNIGQMHLDAIRDAVEVEWIT